MVNFDFSITDFVRAVDFLLDGPEVGVLVAHSELASPVPLDAVFGRVTGGAARRGTVLGLADVDIFVEGAVS